MEVIEYASFQYNYLCARFCFSRSLSALALRFQHSRFRALLHFFGQEGFRPPKSESARIFSGDSSTKVISSEWKIKLILKNLQQQLRMFYLSRVICF